MNPPQFIARPPDWNRIAPALAQEPQLAIDTEANSMYAYRGRICLIQIATAHKSLPMARLCSTHTFLGS